MPIDDKTSLGEALKDFAAVVVTGGSSGIGKSFIKLVENVHPGMLICNLSRREPDIKLPELKLRHVSCDFSQTAEILRGVAEVLSILSREVPEGRVLLINNSGYGSHGPFLEGDLDNELGILNVNIRALVEITGRFLPTLKTRGGAIINVASTAAFQPTPLLATYGASKSFVLNWSLALREELKPLGVAVVAVCPGPTPTGFAARAGVKSGTVPGGPGHTPDVVAEISLRALAKRRACVICGWKNRFIAWGASHLPRTWTAALAKKIIGRVQPAEKKAAKP
ncbi:MAG: SDR family NAD(P)-dependent oxidoreductase [Nibricoccus sp.]